MIRPYIFPFGTGQAQGPVPADASVWAVTGCSFMDAQMRPPACHFIHKRYAVSQGVWGNMFPHEKNIMMTS